MRETAAEDRTPIASEGARTHARESLALTLAFVVVVPFAALALHYAVALRGPVAAGGPQSVFASLLPGAVALILVAMVRRDGAFARFLREFGRGLRNGRTWAFFVGFYALAFVFVAGTEKVAEPPGGLALEGAGTILLLIAAGAVGEELGWRAWLWPRLTRRLGLVAACVVVSLAWTVFHPSQVALDHAFLGDAAHAVPAQLEFWLSIFLKGILPLTIAYGCLAPAIGGGGAAVAHFVHNVALLGPAVVLGSDGSGGFAIATWALAALAVAYHVRRTSRMRARGQRGSLLASSQATV